MATKAQLQRLRRKYGLGEFAKSRKRPARARKRAYKPVQAPGGDLGVGI